MKAIDYVLQNEAEALAFLKRRYPLYHLSNVFFRDVQYGIQEMLERKGMKVRYPEAEAIAKVFIEQLERKKMLVPIDHQSWVLYHEEFRKPPVKSAAAAKPAPAKPAAPGAAAARPAGGLPPLKSATPAAGANPSGGGLPPLKSSAPSIGAGKPEAATPQAPKEPPAGSAQATAAQPEAPKQVPQPESKPAAVPGGKKPLPPLKSSKPVGKG
jgi:hypothetical protein